MRRSRFYPSRFGDQIPWLENFRTKVGNYTVPLNLSAAKVDASVASARFAIYVLSQWLPAARAFGPASTEAVDLVLNGTGAAAVILPTFAAPPLPTLPLPAVAPVPPGVLTLLFDLVEEIKDADGYTDTIGQDLGLIGAEDATTHDAPEMALTVMQGAPCQCVSVGFKKFGHMGVHLESRRNNGPWEFLAIDTDSPYSDERALLVAGTPEIREYRARFWDKGTPNGSWTDVARVTVAP